MVRLRDPNKWRLSARRKFQFHYGTIESVAPFSDNKRYVKFQFHYGTIESKRRHGFGYFHMVFNSTMVRMRVTFPVQLRKNYYIQFHYGTIRENQKSIYIHNFLHFNSTMVRLKCTTHPTRKRNAISIPLWYDWELLGDFGYWKVWGISIPLLYDWERDNHKEIFPYPYISIPLWYDWEWIKGGIEAFKTKFQFHYGTIESKISVYQPHRRSSFQFHYGTIESRKQYSDNQRVLTFQFHYGTIERYHGFFFSKAFNDFNSTMVRLRGWMGRIYYWRSWISIPLWYDWERI